MKKIMGGLQKIGGALMLPIAVLPIAALLLRLGQPDLFNSPMVAAAGDAIFSSLGLLFAVGVAVGLARENHGAAGLAGLVAYLVATKGAQVLIGVPPDALAQCTGAARDLASEAYKAHELSKLSVPVGILSGLMAGGLYNRFYKIALPEYLSFFGGRRFVPIVAGLAGLVLAVAFGTQWQRLEAGMDTVSQWVLHAGSLGLFLYGVLNRVLIVTGLHHIINNFAWFLLGEFHGYTGDQPRFVHWDPTAGAFMAGFFPVMMFGLPAACLAMYHTALPERRRLVGGLLGSIALTSFLTGVTEPVEFTFMFLAPLLYAVHALLTGIAFVVMHALHVRLGFGFSAGFLDYVLNYKYAEHPLLLLPVGAGYFALYYLLFRWVIVRFDLKTPGRAAAEGAVPVPGARADGRAEAWVAALGGAANLVTVDACTTRLRLKVTDQAAVDDAALKGLGARGLVRPGGQALQVVIGPMADGLAGEIREALAAGPAPVAPPARAAIPAAGSVPAAPAARLPVATRDWLGWAEDLLATLGGKVNVRAVQGASSRLRIELADGAAVDAGALRLPGVRGVARPAPGTVHIIVGPEADQAALALRQLLT
jgi:PTS system N-acetylglucosamine-specific IIC component